MRFFLFICVRARAMGPYEAGRRGRGDWRERLVRARPVPSWGGVSFCNHDGIRTSEIGWNGIIFVFRF